MSSLASAFHSIGENRAVTDLENYTKESLVLQKNIFRNRINFVNDIMKVRMHKLCEHNLIYNTKIWKKKGAFYILNVISENVTFLQLMDTPVNVNYALSIVGNWIFDSNYEK